MVNLRLMIRVKRFQFSFFIVTVPEITILLEVSADFILFHFHFQTCGICNLSLLCKDRFRQSTVCPRSSDTFYTVCAGSSDPFYIASLLYRMGHYFLDI